MLTWISVGVNDDDDGIHVEHPPLRRPLPPPRGRLTFSGEVKHIG